VLWAGVCAARVEVVGGGQGEGLGAVVIAGSPGHRRYEALGFGQGKRVFGLACAVFTDGWTVVLKYAERPFEREAAILAHAAGQGVPVPELIASIEWADAAGMLLEDLDTPTREATAADAARVAGAIHAATPIPGLSVLDGPALAELPQAGLAALTALRERGRWVNTDDVPDELARLAEQSASALGAPNWRRSGCAIASFTPLDPHRPDRRAGARPRPRVHRPRPARPRLLDRHRQATRGLRELLAAYVAASASTGMKWPTPSALWPEFDPIFPHGWSDRLRHYFADIRLHQVQR
jgi:hypothetical protein